MSCSIPRVLAAACLVLSYGAASAQLTDSLPKQIVGPRNLALSPDGSRLAFTYRGDIWVVDSKGGKAVPVTNHVEMDDYPLWSPDGNWIAFASNRFGGNSIMAVPADGGETKRLTFFGGNEIPTDWSPDGKKLLFRATRDNAYNGIFELDVKTLQFKAIFEDMMTLGNAKYTHDGDGITYTRFGFPWTRARYEGSAAFQMWRYDLATGKRTPIRNNGLQHLWPQRGYENDTQMTVTVSEKTPSASYIGKPIPRIVDSAARTPNVYFIDASKKALRLTNFVGGGVRFLTVAPAKNMSAFEYEGSVYTMIAGGKPTKLAITATIDDKTTNEERLVLKDGVEDMSLSPKGDRVVFQVRSELWTVPVKKEKGPNADDAEQLTAWEGLDEQPIYAPDGKSVFLVSDRDGARQLFRLDLETKKFTKLTQADSDVFSMRITPDKKRLSFWMTGKAGGIYTVPVEGFGGIEKVMSRPGSEPRGYSWSPDSRWIAYSDEVARSGYYFWDSGSNIRVYDTLEKKSYDITKENAPNSSPGWSSDGKYLYFRRVLLGGAFRGPGSGTGALYILPLQKETARTDDTEMKYEKPKDPVKVEIDFGDIENRSRRYLAQDPQSPIKMDPEKGDLYFISEGDLWKAGYDGGDLKRLTTAGGISDWDFSDDNSQIAYVKAGAMNLINLRAPNTPISAVAFRADWTRDVRNERRAAFNQFWREYNRSFYDGNFHGRDWAATKKRYEPLLDSVGHRNEMATLLNMMVGELEASHTEAGPAMGNPSSANSTHPGFTIDYSYEGPGLKVKDVPKGAPGSYDKTRIKPGEYVLQINGKDVRADEFLYKNVLNEQGGRDITFLVNATPTKTGARTVKYRAVSGGEFSGIVRRNLLEARRKYVEEKSGGKLTYVHIAGMGGGNFDQFQREFWQFTLGKKGVIIDVRNNGGGNISDQLIDIIERKPHSYYVPRDEDAQLAPGQTWGLPTVVMAAETSFSNAEMFPYAMKQRGLATLVGMPTPGYVIWTGGFPLVDGTSARMPGSGVYRMDGSPLEDMGQQMDFKVDITPEEFFAGKDPQLDKAIQVLMGKVK
ncbi:MAG: S41 family peptidase [Fimbriimonadaceae bacterium]